MGCGGSSVITDITTTPQYINITLKKQIKHLITTNPFYNIKYTEMETIISNHLHSSTSNSISSPLSLLLTNISTTFKFTQIQTSIISDVLIFAESKLSTLFPNSNSFHIDLILSVFYFLNKYHDANKPYQKELIIKLINTSLQSSSVNKYETGKVLMIVLNIIQFYLFTFVYCFVSIAVLDLFTTIDYNGIMRLFVEKEKWDNIAPDKLSKIVVEKLKMIDRTLTPQCLTERLLREVFGSIKEIVVEKGRDRVVEIDEENVEKLVEAICIVGNAEEFEEFFFSGKTKIF